MNAARLFFACLLCALCVLCGRFLCDEAWAAEPAVVSVEGGPVEAKLVGFGADGRITFLAKAPLTIPVGELVRWGHPALARPQTLVLLADGSRLVTAADWSGGVAVQLDGETVVVRSDAWD